MTPSRLFTNMCMRIRRHAVAAGKFAMARCFIAKDGQLDGADVAAQIEWYQEQGLVEKSVEAAAIIDFSFIPALQP